MGLNLNKQYINGVSCLKLKPVKPTNALYRVPEPMSENFRWNFRLLYDKDGKVRPVMRAFTDRSAMLGTTIDVSINLNHDDIAKFHKKYLKNKEKSNSFADSNDLDFRVAVKTYEGVMRTERIQDQENSAVGASTKGFAGSDKKPVTQGQDVYVSGKAPGRVATNSFRAQSPPRARRTFFGKWGR